MKTSRHVETARRTGGWLGSGALAAGLALLAACSLPEAQPDLTRFFVLTAATPKAEATTAAAAAEAAEAAPRVVLRPVVVPEFLRGRIMGVRMAENEVKFIDQARWAEPLEAGLNRVLREDLAQQPATVRVVDRGGAEHDFDVQVQLRRCEGVLPAGVARLTARIEVFSADLDPRLVAQGEFATDVAGWDGKDYGQLARKLSEAAAGLSQRIIELLPAKNP